MFGWEKFRSRQKYDLSAMSMLSVANQQLKCSPKPPEILEIFLSKIHLYLSNKNIFWKNERGFWRLVCCEKKPLSILGDSFSFAQDLHFKNMYQTRKFWDPKIRAQRWIQFSQSMTPVGKMREVIVLWHVSNKNLRPFLKMILQSLRIIIWKWWLSTVKTDFFALSVAKRDLNSVFKPPKAKAFDGLEALLERRLATETWVLTFLKGKPNQMFFKLYYKPKALKNDP